MQADWLDIFKVASTLKGWLQEGFGATGEAYLVGPDHLVRSAPRAFYENPDVYFAELKAVGTESFVATEGNPAKATLEIKLAVVKHVIAIRLAEDQAAKAAAAKKLEKEKLLAVLGRKQDAVLENLTEAELLARINNL